MAVQEAGNRTLPLLPSAVSTFARCSSILWNTWKAARLPSSTQLPRVRGSRDRIFSSGLKAGRTPYLALVRKDGLETLPHSSSGYNWFGGEGDSK